MAVYYKFKSAKDYDSIPIDGHFISVLTLKEKIFESKHLGRGTDFDLVVTNAQTNEEYLDEAMLIPKNTSVLIRRIPGRPRMPIVTQPEMPKEDKSEDPEPVKSGFMGAESAVSNYLEDTEWDEFGNDLYAIPEVVPFQPNNPIIDAPPPSKADEDSKIKALVDTPALDWQRQGSDGYGGGRGFGRGGGGRMMGGRGFGRGGFERKTPPQGYVCHRCRVPGHLIQHCPTNGDPNFDVKRVKPPTGIPKSMLMATPEGSYALPSGAVAVLKPNEAAFEKEIEGLPSTRPVGDLPPELHCPLCKEVMKDAVLTSKCCFKSFCDKCIRDHIISKSQCICGVTDVLADDLLPNKTLRDTINRILESNNSSAENAGSAYHVQDMESARCPLPKTRSPNVSAASMGAQLPPPQNEGTSTIKEANNEGNLSSAPLQMAEKGRVAKAGDVSEATLDSLSVREPASQSSAPLAEEEVQQKASGDVGKKKKKKKTRVPVNAVDMPWRASQDVVAENFMMQMGAPSAYNPYWGGMQPGMDGFMGPYGGPMPYMNYGVTPFDMQFGGMMPQDPFGAPGYMLPGVPPQRDLAVFGMGMNPGPPVMSREEFEARKAEVKRKREMERQGFGRRGDMREPFPKDREFGREMSSSKGDISSMKSKSKSHPPPASSDNHRPRRPDSPPSPPRDADPRPLKRKPSDHHHRDEKEHRRLHDDDDDGNHHRAHHHHRRREEDDHNTRRHHRRDEDEARHRSRHHHHHQGDDEDGRDHHHRAADEQPRDHHHRRSESSATSAAAESVSAKPLSSAAADRKHKASVFSRISFPEGEAAAAAAAAGSSKRRVSSSAAEPAGAAVSSSHHKSFPNGIQEDSRKSNMAIPSSSSGGGPSIGRKGSVDCDSSDDDDRHFKRKPSRYGSVPAGEAREEERHSKGSRKREREHSGSTRDTQDDRGGSRR